MVIVASGMGVVSSAAVPSVASSTPSHSRRGSCVSRPTKDSASRPWRERFIRAGRRKSIVCWGNSYRSCLSSEPWPAALVPHAGWVYSGRLAAATPGTGADSPAGDRVLSAASLGRRPVGRLRPMRHGCCPAAAWPPIRNWPHGSRPPSPAWTWTAGPSAGTCHRSSVADPGPAAPQTAGGGDFRRPRRPGGLAAVCRRAGRRAGFHVAAAAAADFQRHEPLCQRC